MDYLGLFCLGAFVGTIATFGLRRVQSIGEWQTVLGFTLPAVLSGAAMVFIDRFKYSPAFGTYPLGLACALLWAYTKDSVEIIKKETGLIKVLAVLHLAAAALVTISGALVATVPAYLQLRAEWAVPRDERVSELRRMRDAARDTSPSTTAVNASSRRSGSDSPKQ